MRFLVSCLVVVVVMATHTPMARAQSEIPAPIGNRPAASSSGILASAERMASMAEAEQDEMFVQRRRSGTLAGVGAALAAAGAVLVLRPPTCELVGSEHDRESLDLFFGTAVWEHSYNWALKDNRCDLRVVERYTFTDNLFPDFGFTSSSVEYRSDRNLLGDDAHDFDGRMVESGWTKRYAGLAMAGAGGALLWFGLRRVEVPFRVDMTTGRGLRVQASRSFGW